MNIQTAGGGYYAGKAKESKSQLTNLRSEMLNEIKRLKSIKKDYAKEDFSQALSYLEDELEEIEMEEEKAAQAPRQSYWAVKVKKEQGCHVIQ